MATQGVLMKLQGVQNATFYENPHENERIVVILGCANSINAWAKHRCTGGWLKLCPHVTENRLWTGPQVIKTTKFEESKSIMERKYV